MASGVFVKKVKSYTAQILFVRLVFLPSCCGHNNLHAYMIARHDTIDVTPFDARQGGKKKKTAPAHLSHGASEVPWRTCYQL